jgi:SAM-dependent methyltransferase
MAAPDPAHIFDTLTAYWHTAALKAALDLDIFTTLGRRALTASQLAAASAADTGSLSALCDSLVSMGLLRKRNGRYHSAEDAARFLDATSPDSLATLPRFFNTPPVTTAFANLSKIVRRGSSTAGVASRRGVWTTFAAATLTLRRRVAIDIADELQRRRLIRGRILDVGAGASPLGITLLRRSRATSLVVQDRGSVVRVARRHAAEAGVSDRMTTLAGDTMTVAWGGPFDLVLMVNVLDYFDPAARARLARKAEAALRPGGTLVISAPLLNDDRASPPDAVAYSLMLLALESKGRPSTFGEMRQLLRDAGFTTVTRCRGLSVVFATRA